MTFEVLDSNVLRLPKELSTVLKHCICSTD